jgi:hypothetical protein
MEQLRSALQDVWDVLLDSFAHNTTNVSNGTSSDPQQQQQSTAAGTNMTEADTGANLTQAAGEFCFVSNLRLNFSDHPVKCYLGHSAGNT